MAKIGQADWVINVDKGAWGIPPAMVTFEKGELTEKELEYVRLVSHTNFFQLIRTAVYMQEGLSFREATIKYLTIQKEIDANRVPYDKRSPEDWLHPWG